MHRSAIVFALYLSFAIAVGAACGQPAPPETPGDDAFNVANGGTNGGSTGGTPMSTGGTPMSTGGTPMSTGGTGGSTGGVQGMTGGATGGTPMTVGGASGSGTMGGAGRAATGGAGGTGGTTGGAPATGGAGGTPMAVGGASGAAGTMSTGTGGMSATSCDAAFAVGMDGFVRMPNAKGGCYSGYAFAGGDTTSTVMIPGGGKDFTMAMGMLKISGTVGSATEANSYAGNVYFGFNIGQATGGSTKATVAPVGASLTVTCTGCSTPPMRVQLVAGSVQWCAPLTSGTAIPYTSFQKECWEGGAMTPYAMEAIDSIQISIPGAAADATFDLTLTSVKEN